MSLQHTLISSIALSGNWALSHDFLCSLVRSSRDVAYRKFPLKPVEGSKNLPSGALRFRVRTQSLWKGTASAVPQQENIDEGFSP
jgi:hypothetical protein